MCIKYKIQIFQVAIQYVYFTKPQFNKYYKQARYQSLVWNFQKDTINHKKIYVHKWSTSNLCNLTRMVKSIYFCRIMRDISTIIKIWKSGNLCHRLWEIWYIKNKNRVKTKMMSKCSQHCFSLKEVSIMMRSISKWHPTINMLRKTISQVWLDCCINKICKIYR